MKAEAGMIMSTERRNKDGIDVLVWRMAKSTVQHSSKQTGSAKYSGKTAGKADLENSVSIR
jgi:hypothetical protein